MKNRVIAIGILLCGTIFSFSCAQRPKELQSRNQSFDCLSAALKKSEAEREKIMENNEISWEFDCIFRSEKGTNRGKGIFNIDQEKMKNDDISGLEGEYSDENGKVFFNRNRLFIDEENRKDYYDAEMTFTEALQYFLPFDIRYVYLLSVADYRLFDWMALEMTSDQIFDYYVTEISSVSSLNISSLITKKDRKLLVESLDVIREQLRLSLFCGGTTARIEYEIDSTGIETLFDAVNGNVKSAIRTIESAEYSTIYSKAVENIYRTIGEELEKNEENVKKTEILRIVFPIEKEKISSVLTEYTISGVSFSNEFRSNLVGGYSELRSFDEDDFTYRGTIDLVEKRGNSAYR